MPLRRILPLLAALLALNTVLLVAWLGVSAWRMDVRASASLRSVDQLRRALVAAEMVSRERGPTNGLLGEPGPAAAQRLRALQEARARTDLAWEALAQALPALATPQSRLDNQQHLDAARAALARARSAVDRTAARPIGERAPQEIRDDVHAMVEVVPLLAPIVGQIASEAQEAYPAIGDDVQGARLTAELREYAGLLGSHFTAALAHRSKLTAAERLAIERTRGRIDELRFLVGLRVEEAGRPEDVGRAWRAVQDRYFGVARELVDGLVATGEADGAYPLDAAGFAARYVPEMNVMFTLRDTLLDHAEARARTVRDRSTRELLGVGIVSCIVLSVLGATLWWVHRRVLRPLVRVAHSLTVLAHNEPEPSLPDERGDEITLVTRAVRALREQTAQRERLERERDELIERLREQSYSDFLTGLPNRRAFFDTAERALAQARRHGDPVAVLLFDIDNFKSFNDRLGHAAGDEVLACVGRVVSRELRRGDLVARHGGEEFVMLLQRCLPEQAVQFADRLRRAIAEEPIACPDGSSTHVTVSVGVATAGPADAWLESLLSLADAAMYRAKDAGRDRVELARAESRPGADAAPETPPPASAPPSASASTPQPDA